MAKTNNSCITSPLSKDLIGKVKTTGSNVADYNGKGATNVKGAPTRTVSRNGVPEVTMASAKTGIPPKR